MWSITRGNEICIMHHQTFLGVLFAVLLSFDKISAASVYKKTKSGPETATTSAESYGTGLYIDVEQSFENDNGNEEVNSSSLGKRSCDTGKIARVSPVGILKGTTERPRRNVTFGQNSTRVFTSRVPYYDQAVEQNYIDTLYSKNFQRAAELKREGLNLSNTSDVYRAINKLLTYPQPHKKIIHALFEQQPHVFTQHYPYGRSVFENVPLDTINFITKNYGEGHPEVLRKIQMEAIRNPQMLPPKQNFQNTQSDSENSSRNVSIIETDSNY